MSLSCMNVAIRNWSIWPDIASALSSCLRTSSIYKKRNLTCNFQSSHFLSSRKIMKGYFIHFFQYVYDGGWGKTRSTQSLQPQNSTFGSVSYRSLEGRRSPGFTLTLAHANVAFLHRIYLQRYFQISGVLPFPRLCIMKEMSYNCSIKSLWPNS